MLLQHGEKIILLTLNTALADLSFTPNHKDNPIKLNSIEWSDIHFTLIRLIANKISSIGEGSFFEIREDITFTFATLKKFAYF